MDARREKKVDMRWDLRAVQHCTPDPVGYLLPSLVDICYTLQHMMMPRPARLPRFEVSLAIGRVSVVVPKNLDILCKEEKRAGPRDLKSFSDQ